MNIFLIIIMAIGSIIVILLLAALFVRREYFVQSELIIHAPSQKVFDYLKFLKNQDHFNKWVMVDPNMKKEFRGTDGTVGFVYGWNGNKRAGEGEQEIKSIEDGKKIGTEIRFVRPFVSIAYADLITTTVSADQTKVTWSNKSTMNYPMNVMISMIEKMLTKDMDESLLNLKNILEK